jgi:thiol-disulfide isomerase/thioredoxin
MPMRIGTELPALEGGTEWRNGDPAAADALKGHVSIIHFWAVSCHTCSDLMPKVNEWRDTLAAKGVRVIGVHMPRYEADTQLEPVYEAIEKYGLTHPVVIDNLHKIADAFGNEYVPAFYLFDREGKLKSFAAGEKAAGIIQPALDRLLASLEK